MNIPMIGGQSRLCCKCIRSLFFPRKGITEGAVRYGQASITPHHRSIFTVSIEGNVGVGKSTLLNFFQKFSAAEAVNEQVSRWTSIHGNHNALLSPVRILERSVYSTRYVFIENSYKSGHLTELEYQVLVEWFDSLIATQNLNVDLMVYLRASPETCLDRIRTRGRKEETSISLEFIEGLHVLHEDLFSPPAALPPCAPRPLGSTRVLLMDANLDLSKMCGVYEAYKSHILGTAV